MASKPDKTSAYEISPSNLGKRIIALRVSLKISQSELGKRVGASAMSISRWESEAKRPSANYLIKFGLLSTADECWFFWGQAGLTIADVMRVMPRSKGGHV
jgi:DNA-binding XRE family transcriptional regulator